MTKAAIKLDVADRLREKLVDEFNFAPITQKDAAKIVTAVFECIKEMVSEGSRIVIADFGVFSRVLRPAREARNPRTNEKVAVPVTYAPKFSPGKGFKELVKGNLPEEPLE